MVVVVVVVAFVLVVVAVAAVVVIVVVVVVVVALILLLFLLLLNAHKFTTFETTDSKKCWKTESVATAVLLLKYYVSIESQVCRF